MQGKKLGLRRFIYSKISCTFHKVLREGGGGIVQECLPSPSYCSNVKAAGMYSQHVKKTKNSKPVNSSGKKNLSGNLIQLRVNQNEEFRNGEA